MKAIATWFVICVSLALVGCGAPVLRNAWRPDPAVVAGVSAAAATIVVLLDPEAHRRLIEKAYLDAMPEQRPMRVTEVVTAEVLDRLDALEASRRATARGDQLVSR